MQTFGKFGISSVAGLLALAVFGTSAANARRVVVDDPWPMPSAGYCLLNPSFQNPDCNPVSLGFFVGNAGVNHSKLYIYDDGLVSFGAPVGNWQADFAIDFGSPVIVTGLNRIVFDDSVPGDPLTPIFAAVDRNSGSEISILWFLGEPAFVGGIELDADGNPVLDDDGNQVLKPGSYAYIAQSEAYQRLTLKPIGNGRTQALVEFIPGGLRGDNSMADVTNLFEDSTTYSFEFGAAIPEPATWAMLIAGFGLVGGSFRVRRAKTA